MHSIWVVIFPIILLLFSIGMSFYFIFYLVDDTHRLSSGSNTAMFIWAGDESPRSSLLYSRWMVTVYPISFAQNTITTGLIAFKIWQQHRISSSAGARNASSITLPKVLMIVIESAMIYTLQQLALIILYFLGSNGQYIVCGAIAPSIGERFFQRHSFRRILAYSQHQAWCLSLSLSVCSPRSWAQMGVRQNSFKSS